MKKYFCASDIHSFYSEWRNALHKKGFEEDNPNHIILICGDLFDRGYESCQCYNFVEKLAAQNRLIYIRGNHEDLLYDCVKGIKRGSYGSHHISNGTIQSIADFLEVTSYDILSNCFEWSKFDRTMNRVLDFIETNAKDYYELGDFIFVHGWVPTTPDSEGYEIIHENWRDGDWRDARWSNGMEHWSYNLIVPNKTIVCGHWHCNFGHHMINNDIPEWGKGAIFDPFIKNGIIAIDRCTAMTKWVNVIIFEEDNEGNVKFIMEESNNG